MGFINPNLIDTEEFFETPESIDMRKKEFLRNFVAEFMEKFTNWVGGAHVKCSKDGLITEINVPINQSSDFWYESNNDISIIDFLHCLKYIDDNGKEVTFNSDEYTDKDLFQCIKYFMKDEAIKRSESVHISRDEYLDAMFSENMIETLYETIEENAFEEKDDYFENTLMAPVEWVDVVRSAAPAFRKLHIHNLLFQIRTSIELLNDCTEVEVAVENIKKLRELETKMKKAAPEEVIPDDAFELCCENVEEYSTMFSYYDFVDKQTFYSNLISECQQYTYTIPEVAAILFKNTDTDSYTLEADKETLHKLVEAHPTQISKDGVPYTPDEVDTMVELASAVGWEAASSGLGEVINK